MWSWFAASMVVAKDGGFTMSEERSAGLKRHQNDNRRSWPWAAVLGGAALWLAVAIGAFALARILA